MDPRVLSEVRRLVVPEHDQLAAARERSTASTDPAPEVGALLAVLAGAVQARHVVEVGAASGLTALWLLEGMPPKGVLTSVEPDPDAHALAGQAYAQAGVNARVRSILGHPDEVLPRLSDGAYDLCLLQTGLGRGTGLLDPAVRLLRPGGVLVARRVLTEGRSDDEAAALAAFTRSLGEDERLQATLLPVDAGLAVATVTG